MSGESKLDVLLQTMRPVLHPEPFTFCTIAGHNLTQLSASVLHSALGLFREAEGITAILPVADAEQAGLVSHGGWALITLSIHSDLNAVGFLAAVTARLADAKISVNAVSAYYHDHLFVPWDDRERAMYTAATFELMSTIG